MGTRWLGLAVLLTLLGGLLLAGAAEAQDELFVSSYHGDSITTFRRTAGGNVAPVRTLKGPATGLAGPVAVAVDVNNDELIVANGDNDSITVYSRTASGNTAPLRTLAGPATGLAVPRRLVLDFTHQEGGPGVGALYVTNAGNHSVTVYLWPTGGNVAPMRTLGGPATQLTGPSGLALDLVNDELLVVSSIPPSVNAYRRTASGNTPPLRTLAGPATGLSGPTDLAVDYTHLEGGPGVGALYVTNAGIPDSVTVYLWPTGGNVAPMRTLSGPATQLASASSLAFDFVNDELVVVNSDLSNAAVTVYSRTASGNTGPLRVLAGTVTGLSAPTSVAVAVRARAVDRDFNGDGKSDLLLRDLAGTIAIWLMNGASVISKRTLGTAPADWTIVGVGDFNGDARADLLWRHTSGATAVLLMNGTAPAGAASIGTITTDWTIERVGDFNGDGKADILWRHTFGDAAIWFMNGTAVISKESLSPGQIDPEWTIQ